MTDPAEPFRGPICSRCLKAGPGSFTTDDGGMTWLHMPFCPPPLASRQELQARLDVLQQENARLKTALRINLLRYGPPGTTHKSIDDLIAQAGS
jgi:hypothetical protein